MSVHVDQIASIAIVTRLIMADLGHWEGLLTEETLPYGFVYKITNLTNNRKYIGKKQCLTLKKRPPLKGKKNRRISEIETDWKSYTSSSKELNEDIIKNNLVPNIPVKCIHWFIRNTIFENDISGLTEWLIKTI